MEHTPIPPPWVPPPVRPAFTFRVIERHPRPQQRIGAVVALLGAAAVAAGTFLPWFTADVEGLGLRSGNAWSNRLDDSSWGPLMLLAALVIAASAAPTIVNVRSVPVRSLGLGAAGLAVVISIVQVVELLGSQANVEVSLAFGVIVLVAGSLVAFLGAIVAARGDGGAKVAPSRAVGAVG